VQKYTKGVIGSRKSKTKRPYNEQKKKREKIQTMMCKTLYRKLYIEQHETTKIGSDLIVRGTVDKSCSTSGKAKGKSQKPLVGKFLFRSRFYIYRLSS
jgi:hypothetical protein